MVLLCTPSARFGFINCDDDVYVFNNEHVSSGLKLNNVIFQLPVRRADRSREQWIS